MKKYSLIATSSGQRIDSYLATEILASSRSEIARAILQKQVWLNKEVVTKASLKVELGDVIEVELAKPAELTEVLAEEMPLDIIYEDSSLLIVNKPQGIVVHPGHGHHRGTLVNGLAYYLKDQLSDLNGIMRPGIVHRLDKDTSGLLMIAKNNEVHRKLAEQLKARTVSRKYKALVWSRPESEAGRIIAPIARSPEDRQKMAVVAGGKYAETSFSCLEIFRKKSLLALSLATGRTHQIRVHLAYINCPVVGDAVYAPSRSSFSLSGQALHAYALSFLHPLTGEKIQFTADLPPSFSSAILRAREE